MPAYSFKAQFIPLVEKGEKLHTIRGKRKNRPRPGQPFYAYYAMRTKQCRKLLESVITHVQDITIVEACRYVHYLDGVDVIDGRHIILAHPKIAIDGEELAEDEMVALARRDGFADLNAMMMFWPLDRLPFSGDLIHWKSLAHPTNVSP